MAPTEGVAEGVVDQALSSCFDNPVLEVHPRFERGITYCQDASCPNRGEKVEEKAKIRSELVSTGWISRNGKTGWRQTRKE